MTAKRRAHSKVAQLPPEFREAIHDAIARRGATYDELIVLVNGWVRDGKLPADSAPSRAGLARYGKNFLARMEQLNLAREQARAVVAKSEEYGMALDEAATNLVLSEIMSIFMSRDPGAPMDPGDIARVAAGLGKLQQSSASREKIKTEFEKRAREASKKATGALKRAGASQEAIKEIEGILMGGA